MIEDVDTRFEQVIRETWAAAGYRPEDLPTVADARMQRILAHLRDACVKLMAGEVARLQRREADLEQRLADIEERMGELEARVGLGGITLQ